jgi:hypothetical protein
MVHPPERRLKPVPRSALAWHAGGRTAGRGAIRSNPAHLKEMIEERH